VTAMLKTCLSPTDGTRTKTLPSGYEMSRQVINYKISQQVRIDKFSRGLKETPLMRWRWARVDHPLWLKVAAHLDLVYGGTE